MEIFEVMSPNDLEKKDTLSISSENLHSGIFRKKKESCIVQATENGLRQDIVRTWEPEELLNMHSSIGPNTRRD